MLSLFVTELRTKKRNLRSLQKEAKCLKDESHLVFHAGLPLRMGRAWLQGTGPSAYLSFLTILGWGVGAA